MAKLKKILLMGVSYVLIAALAIGGTLAYLKDEDSAVNVMTLGNVSIEQHEYERATNADGTYKTATIDGVTSYVLKKFTQGKSLLPIVGDPSLPGDNAGYAGFDSTVVRMTQVGSYGSMQVFAGKNAQDKFVTVENTGKTDAYVRTLVAIECGTGNAKLIGTGSRCVDADKAATSTMPWIKYEIGKIVVDNNTYFLFEYVYRGASDVKRHENGILPAGDTTYPNLAQVYLSSTATNEDCIALDGNGNGTLDILVYSQAVQANGFDDAETALNAGFGDITTTNHPWSDDAPAFSVPKNDAEFENALKDTTSKQIIVNLEGDVTYDVAAWASDAMGGNVTELIMINGNGHTITFNQTNSDWNNIVTNGAKLIINNAKITNAGYNDGPWNRHDLNFACDVELNNVVSDKALAFKAGATLNNVTISDANTSDTYAIWIQPNGQAVTLDNCVIDMLACTDGRGIKIDNQYIGDAAKKVTLNVSNTTFKTEEKSAIIVKTPAGAEINLFNLDIYGVTADPVNAVWVDEASAAYADLVVVNGGKKVVENQAKTNVVASKSEMKNALTNAVANGETDIVINANGQTIDMSYGLNTSTVPAGTTVTIYNANIAASSYGNAVDGTVVFENCTFENPNGAYSIHFDAGNGNVVFNNCTLAGWCSFGSAIKSVEMNNCTILGNGIYAMTRFYQDTVMNNCVIDCSNTITDDKYVDGLSIVGGATLTLNDCTLIYSDLEVGAGSKLVADGSVLVDAVDYTLIKNADR